ncbi:hypothetical protein MBM_09452 [Drepanopeziza brunnea f. sp. 'multigermtubi' MB_m1]|uniref:Uncharacterized protein n=1 Tax=Marssonina brunnea f. sp. multigermtubi (strain MB_m1) TaxID=1072389 RepID=K1WUV5_MARBU|nr:uncharacterized protein MBM_09452 [Drepanopeziza brunnea f. sp. 'multigermtubi' MB_m1]EKD12418.1 hypothetical protein MBM_09452 [Drepanopeziza brunnea f. sp. 'multigermtubi' MB_m1]
MLTDTEVAVNERWGTRTPREGIPREVRPFELGNIDMKSLNIISIFYPNLDEAQEYLLAAGRNADGSYTKLSHSQLKKMAAELKARKADEDLKAKNAAKASKLAGGETVDEDETEKEVLGEKSDPSKKYTVPPGFDPDSDVPWTLQSKDHVDPDKEYVDWAPGSYVIAYSNGRAHMNGMDFGEGEIDEGSLYFRTMQGTHLPDVS